MAEATAQRMKVAFDASVIILAVSPTAAVPDPPKGVAASSASGRIKHLIARLDQEGVAIVIPTPALAEVLEGAGGAAADTLRALKSQARIRFAAFGERAAIEYADFRNTSLPRTRAGPRAKVKFDHQIMAIARVEAVQILYSDDKGMRTLGARAGIEVKGVWDLPMPPDEIAPPLPGVLRDDDGVPRRTPKAPPRSK